MSSENNANSIMPNKKKEKLKKKDLASGSNLTTSLIDSKKKIYNILLGSFIILIILTPVALIVPQNIRARQVPLLAANTSSNIAIW
ncbi:MAG: hypothetical protein ACTSVC_09445, partial [Promethearchaeota archaeon]